MSDGRAGNGHALKKLPPVVCGGCGKSFAVQGIGSHRKFCDPRWQPTRHALVSRDRIARTGRGNGLAPGGAAEGESRTIRTAKNGVRRGRR